MFKEVGQNQYFFGYLQLVPNVKLYCSRLLLWKSIRKTQMYLSPLALSKGSCAGGLLSLIAQSVHLQSHTTDFCRCFFWNSNKYVLLHFLFFACLSFEMCNVILWVQDVWHMLSAICNHSPCIWCAWWHHLTELCYKAMARNFEFWMTILKLQKKV
jgi:hypothetical protein